MSAPAPSGGSSAGADHPAYAPAPAAAASSSGSKRSCPGAATDARRVQPRHPNDCPNSTAAAAAASASSTGSAEAERPPPVSRLYRHALESIFAFLGRDELVAALQVSRGWLAAVKSMRCMQWRYPVPSVWPLSVIADSAMARHFTALGAPSTPVQLSTDSLWILARGMAHVRVLTCGLWLSPQAHGPLTFPAALKELDVAIQASITAAQVNAVIQSVGRLPLLETFTIRLPAADEQISFAPLVASPQLGELCIFWHWNGHFSNAQVDELRSMPHLRRLSATIIASSLLRRLIRQPHALQWQALPWLLDLDDEAAECLTSLPSLTDFRGWVMCERFEWLQRLPNLSVVHLFDGGAAHPAPARTMESLAAGLQHCTQIRQLALAHFSRLTAAHLADLLPRLPLLHTLVLGGLCSDSLAFLAQLPTAHQLTHLTLRNCGQLPLGELRHVHALGGLESLIIDRSFNRPMDPLTRSLHTPPSAALPLLTEFSYTAPAVPPAAAADDDDGDEVEGDHT